MVLDELWPEASPDDALNSLHQAMYYLRRCIDRWYEDSTSADYVVLESEIVYLDPNLVLTDSLNFHHQAASALGNENPSLIGYDALKAYRGFFAPEFEYEEWAIDYRARTHAQYLQLVHRVVDCHLIAGEYQSAAACLMTALRLDPSAFELESQLVVALWRQGSRAAALEQYRHFAHAHTRELGMAPPRLDELLLANGPTASSE